MKTTIKEKGYKDVECDTPLPCPFCGGDALLCQLAHRTTSRRVGRKFETVKICIIASNNNLEADTFWFKCPACNCTSGGHHDTAQKAAEAWNTRKKQWLNRVGISRLPTMIAVIKDDEMIAARDKK